jgi:hypothetical protein
MVLENVFVVGSFSVFNLDRPSINFYDSDHVLHRITVGYDSSCPNVISDSVKAFADLDVSVTPNGALYFTVLSWKAEEEK